MAILPPFVETPAVPPSYAGGGLGNLAASVLRIFGGASDELLPPLDDDMLPPSLLAGVRRVVLLLVDGFGIGQLERGLASGDARVLQQVVSGQSAHLSTITSVFPSATMAALASVHTGVAPSRHGVLGWTMFLEEFGRSVEMARWGPVDQPGTSYQDAKLGGHDPLTFLGVPTLYQRLAALDIPSYCVNPVEYRGTALSRMLFAGALDAPYRGASGLPLALERVLSTLDEGFVYGYHPGLDTTTHLNGPLSPEHNSELALVDFLIGRWLERTNGDGNTLVLLTADHGHLHTPPENTLFVDQEQAVVQHLRSLPNGERRMLYLHAKPGQEELLRQAAEEKWGHIAQVIPSHEVLDSGLLGPGEPGEAARRRAGDFVLLARDAWQMTFAPRPDRALKAFKGNHGGLTLEEMLVPLLAWRI